MVMWGWEVVVAVVLVSGSIGYTNTKTTLNVGMALGVELNQKQHIIKGISGWTGLHIYLL